MDRIKYRIEKAADGNDTVIIEKEGRSLPLHSRRQPLREGEKSKFQLNPERYDVLVIMGFGLGYYFVPAMEKLKEYGKVIVIDILPGIEDHIEGGGYLAGFLEYGNVTFVTGEDEKSVEEFFKRNIDFSEIRGIEVSEHPASMRMFQEYYGKIGESLSRVIDEKSRNAATSKKFGKLFFRNALNNIMGGGGLRCVSKLFGRFKNRAALIVSSAPSIEEAIEYIPEISNYAYIIAVDSAVPLLKEYGVFPDFVVSIDPQGVMGEHLNGVDAEKSVFVYTVVSPPPIIKKTGGYLSLNSHPLSQVFEQVTKGRVGSIDSATGSVAGDALNFAMKAGFSEIGMAGFDFSFYRNKIYARGTAYQRRYNSIFNTRIRTIETYNSDYIYKNSRSLIQGGRYTRRAFLEYKDSLAKVTAGHDKLWFINSTGPEYLPVNMAQTDVCGFIDAIKNRYEKDGTDVNYSKNEGKSDYLIEKKEWSELLTQDEVLTQVVEASFGSDNIGEMTAYARYLLSKKLSG